MRVHTGPPSSVSTARGIFQTPAGGGFGLVSTPKATPLYQTAAATVPGVPWVVGVGQPRRLARACPGGHLRRAFPAPTSRRWSDGAVQIGRRGYREKGGRA
jgi:hypothetical protein